MLWIDNFSRIYGNRFVREHREAYENCLWTVIAKHVIDGDMNMVFDDEIRAIPALPNNCIFEGLSNFFGNLAEFDYEYTVRECVSVNYDIVYCPPGVPLDRCKEFKDFQFNVRVHAASNWKSSIKYSFEPVDIWRENVGSNIGLMRVVLKLLDAQKIHGQLHHYCWILSDINIFNRLLKVIIF